MSKAKALKTKLTEGDDLPAMKKIHDQVEVNGQNLMSDLGGKLNKIDRLVKKNSTLKTDSMVKKALKQMDTAFSALSDSMSEVTDAIESVIEDMDDE